MTVQLPVVILHKRFFPHLSISFSVQEKANAICDCIDKNTATPGDTFSYAPVSDCFNDCMPVGFLEKEAMKKKYRSLKKILLQAVLKEKMNS